MEKSEEVGKEAAVSTNAIMVKGGAKRKETWISSNAIDHSGFTILKKMRRGEAN
jgi:hypothetical protein